MKAGAIDKNNKEAHGLRVAVEVVGGAGLGCGGAATGCLSASVYPAAVVELLLDRQEQQQVQL